MTRSVNERARAIATFRYIAVRLMETLAAWTPATPEMEVKVMFGRHIWQLAQHADALGKRTFELRQPEHYTLRPSSDYVQLLERIAALKSTTDRLVALYDVLLPALDRRYSKYAQESDPILDAPSLLIIDRIMRDLRRMIDDASDLRARCSIRRGHLQDFETLESRVANLVAG